MFHLITREFLRPFVTTVLILTLPTVLFAQIQDASYRPAIHEPFIGHPIKSRKKRTQQLVGRKTVLSPTMTTVQQHTPPVENLTPAYLSGESKVVVQGNQNPLVRLGMAQNGVTMIELPASDRFFAIHTGNSDLVTVEKSPTMTSDHYLVLRAGSGFITPPPVRTFKGKDGRPVTTPRTRDLPVTSIIVQMRSGMALTFLIYPVQYLAQQAHRCVVSYNRTDVVTARQAAGLAVNLKEEDQLPSATVTKAVSPVASATAVKADEMHPHASLSSSAHDASASSVTTTARNIPAALVQVMEEAPLPAATKSPSYPNTIPPKLDRSQAVVVDVVSQNKRSVFLSKSNAEVDADAAAQAGLTSATKEPKRFKHWTASVHGLSVSALPATDLNDRLRMVVLGVRNTLSGPVRLVPGHPDLFIETLTGDSNNSGGGKPVEIERVRKVTSLSTTANRVIPSGSIVFFALVFEAPILGAKQHLRLAVAQTDAADEPAGADLTAKTR